MMTTAALTVAANWHTMEGLFEIMPTEDRTCYAALSKDSEPVKVDEITYEVTLRDGAKFHNGEDVTAEDVVFSFERVLDPANQSLYAGFIPFLDSVQAKDDKTVTLKLKYPFSLVKERLANVKIVPKAAAQDKEAFDANPVGTGPYKMTDNGSASAQVVFEKFPDYTGPKPAKADKMVWQILPDASTRTNAIESKSVQAIDSVPYLSIDQVKGSANVESVQGFGLLFIMFNNGDNSPMKDQKNRQAASTSRRPSRTPAPAPTRVPLSSRSTRRCGSAASRKPSPTPSSQSTTSFRALRSWRTVPRSPTPRQPRMRAPTSSERRSPATPPAMSTRGRRPTVPTSTSSARSSTLSPRPSSSKGGCIARRTSPAFSSLASTPRAWERPSLTRRRSPAGSPKPPETSAP